MEGLNGKVAVITGASSGIGQAIAVRLAREGCDIVINYRKDLEGAEETEVQALNQACDLASKECGVETLTVQGDVAQEADILNLFQATVERFGRLDILVNNAGIQIEQPSHEVTAEQLDRVLNVNLRGAYLAAREAVKQFLAQTSPGVIINISSVHEIIPRPQYISYSMSKGAMGNMTRTLALEYAHTGIRVNGIAPGATVTPINQAWTEDTQKQAEVEKHIPMRRAGTPAEMAAAVAFLASDEAAYITGQTLYIDGGLTLYADFREAWSA